MPRFILGLALCCAAFITTGATVKAAGDELSSCLDPSTAIEAGGDISDKELAAPQSACAHLKQSTQDPKILGRINAAAANLATEAQRRQSKY